ncbi:hypothetical protein [Bacillus salacetis]|nr:hypothetical protein [Bacillus salacetis]
MAIGIFLFASIDRIPFLGDAAAILVLPYLFISLIIFLSIIAQVLQPDFLTPFINNPVNSFVMGSWIAGISVVCNVVLKFYPEAEDILLWIAVCNSVVFFLFLFFYLRNIFKLFKGRLKHEVHGVVLLSTVSTQSIVILWIELNPSLPYIISAAGIAAGLCFYIAGTGLILARFLHLKDWSLAEDWANTNCIIHGALSISGLALTLSHILPPVWLMRYWLIALFFFAVIEAIEMARAYKRMQIYGWRKGLLTYQVSQWSRNFTFGMLFAFTNTLVNDPFYTGVHLPFQSLLITILPWVVFLLLILEICLWIDSRLFERLFS